MAGSPSVMRPFVNVHTFFAEDCWLPLALMSGAEIVMLSTVRSRIGAMFPGWMWALWRRLPSWASALDCGITAMLIVNRFGARQNTACPFRVASPFATVMRSTVTGFSSALNSLIVAVSPFAILTATVPPANEMSIMASYTFPLC